MFIYRKSIISPSESYNTSPSSIKKRFFSLNRRGSVNKNSKTSYTPMQISSLKIIPHKKQSITLPGIMSILTKSNAKNDMKKPLGVLKKKIMQKNQLQGSNFNFVYDEKTKKILVLQSIEKYKQIIEGKYSHFYSSLAGGMNKPITMSDLLNYMRIKKCNREIKLLPWQSEAELTNKEGLVSRIIMEIFDLNSDGCINPEEFFCICSVHHTYYNALSFSFFSIPLLLKLSDKIEELRVNFQKYLKNEIPNIEYLLHFLTDNKTESNRRSFCGLFNGHKLDFLLYLRLLPLFQSIESCKLS